MILNALVAIKMYRTVHTGGKSQEGGAMLGMTQPLAFKSPANHTAPLAATKVQAYSTSHVSMLKYLFKNFASKPHRLFSSEGFQVH